MESDDTEPTRDASSAETPARARRRPIDPELARRNRRTAGVLILLVLASLLLAFYHFGAFK